jgi:hypothetical protein
MCIVYFDQRKTTLPSAPYIFRKLRGILRANGLKIGHDGGLYTYAGIQTGFVAQLWYEATQRYPRDAIVIGVEPLLLREMIYHLDDGALECEIEHPCLRWVPFEEWEQRKPLAPTLLHPHRIRYVHAAALFRLSRCVYREPYVWKVQRPWEEHCDMCA